MRKITLLFALVFSSMVMAQVTTVPGIIQKGYDGEITIIFNPNEGNGGMKDATECYAHTGLITAESSNDTNWKFVVDTWCGKLPKTKMTKDGTNWKLVISNIYEYYGCPKSTDIKKLAFVFNDGINGSKEGKTSDGKDIMVELVEAGLAVSITSAMLEISKQGDKVKLQCIATESAQLALMLNGKEVAAKEGTELIYNKLIGYLKSKGLAVIDAQDQTFDTDLHEAVAQFPVEDEEKKGKVFDVVQTGYTLNGKVIRFAKVVVGI